VVARGPAGETVTEALGWGALAASSLVIGAVIGGARPWPPRAIGLVLGFGAGALISAVSFELAQDGVEIGGGAAVGIGLAVGALAYYVGDGVVEGRRSPHRGAIQRREESTNPGNALALGAFLDGVPEQLVLGVGLATGEGVSVGLLAAIFVSNLPEAIGASDGMRQAGHSRQAVLRLWLGVAVVLTLATVGGYGIADAASDELLGGINGFAAGALIVMLVDSMVPEATRQAGRTTGLVTTLGFALAMGLSGVT
jgi:ZIP family zinc transporter